MVKYSLSSYLDACYAATALLLDFDRAVVLTVGDRIPGLKETDPRDFTYRASFIEMVYNTWSKIRYVL